MYNLDGVALSGSLLASLLNEAASPYAASEQKQVRSAFKVKSSSPSSLPPAARELQTSLTCSHRILRTK